jgi:thiamine biosynthesis lipoprotein
LARSRPEILTPRARVLLPIFLVVLVTLTARSLWCASPVRTHLGGETMGTTWAVTLNAPGLGPDERARARAVIAAALDDVNERMSTWKPDSELSRFNQHASTQPFALSASMLHLLELAQGVSERTGGAFDVTVRPLVGLWGFGAGARLPGHEPAANELEALRERVGYGLVELDPGAGTARKLDPAVECDLSAIAKGFGVDEVARSLLELGHADFLVEVGGEVRAQGQRPGGGPWRLAIEKPDAEGRVVHAVVPLANLAMATSGDYRSFYEVDGQRRSHIVDPRTGRPVSHGLASATVVHPDAVLADAWATALTVLGFDEGAALAEAEGIAAHLISRRPDGSLAVRTTPGFPSLEDPRAPAGEDAPDGEE